MMNLGELFIKIDVDDSAIESIGRAYADVVDVIESVEKSIEQVNKSINSMEASTVAELATGFAKIGDDGERAASSTSNLAKELEDAVLHGTLFADVIEKAFSTAVDLAGQAANAVAGFVQDSVQGFAAYEQNVESLQRTFDSDTQNLSGDMLAFFQENSAAFGMSVNQMMEHANKTGVILQKDNAQRRAQETAGEKESTQVQKQELSNRLEDLRASLSAQVSETRSAQQENYNSWKDHYDSVYREQKQYLEDSYDATKKELDDEVDAFKRATDARVKEINREYTERYKLIDEQKYNELKALQDQIDALDERNESIDLAAEERNNLQKKADLEYKASNEKFKEDREKAARDLEQLEYSIKDKSRKRDNNNLKKSLRSQMDEVRNHYDNMKSELKEQQQEEVETYKTNRDIELKQLEDANAQKLKEIKRSNDEELRNLKQAQSEQLSQLKKSQAEELAAIQEHNRKVLQEQRNLISEQKSNITQASKMGTGYAPVTDEDRLQSMQTLKSLFQTAADVGAARNMTTDEVLNIFESMNYGRFATFDNLGLGYANKTGIAQMVSDMGQKLGRDLDPENFNDVAIALEALIDDFNMTGRAGKEARETLSGSFNALKSTWENFKVALATEDPNDDNAVLNRLFYGSGEDGDEGTVMNFLNNLLPVVGRILEALSKFIKERGPEIFDRVWDTVVSALPPEWTQALTELGDSIGNTVKTLAEMMPTVGDIVNGIKGIFDTINGIVGTANNLTGQEGLGGVATILGTVGTALAALWTVGKIKDAVELLGKLKDVLGLVGGAGGLGGLGDAASAGAKGVGSLGDAAAGAAGTGGLGGLSSTLSGLGGSLASVLGPTAIATGAFAGTSLLTYGILDATGSIDRFHEAVDSGAYDATTQYTHMANTAAEMHRQVADAYNGSAVDIDVSTSAAAQSVANSTQSISDSVTAQSGLTSNWTDALVNFFTGASETTATSTEQIKTTISEGLNAINANVSENTESINTGWGESMISMDENAKGAMLGVANSTTTALANVKASFDGSEQSLVGSGSALIGGFQTGINAAWPNISNTLSSRKTDVTNSFNGSESWLSASGSNTVSGLHNGMVQKWNSSMTEFLSSVGNKITQPFSNSGTWLESNGSNIMTGLYNGLVRTFNNTVAPLIKSIGTWMHNNDGPEQKDKSVLYKNGQWFMEGLGNGLEDGFNDTVAPYIENISSVFDDFAYSSEPKTMSEYQPQLRDNLNKVKFAYDEVASDIKKSWEDSLDEMIEKTREFTNESNGMFGEVDSPFANNVLTGIAYNNRRTQTEQQQPKQLNIILELDRVQFGRMVYNLNNDETQRVGVRLAGGAI